MLRKLTVTAFAVLFMTSALHAQNVAYTTVKGEQVKLNVDKMMSKINWSNDFSELKKKAQAEKKMIFWVDIVGEIDGGL